MLETKEGLLRVEFGHTMPFFRRYRVEIDGVEVKDAASPFLWKLKPGSNRLRVAPVDIFNKVGVTSALEVSYARPN